MVIGHFIYSYLFSHTHRVWFDVLGKFADLTLQESQDAGWPGSGFYLFNSFKFYNGTGVIGRTTHKFNSSKLSRVAWNENTIVINSQIVALAFVAGSLVPNIVCLAISGLMHVFKAALWWNQQCVRLKITH